MLLPDYPRRVTGTAYRDVDGEGGLVVLPDKREVKVLNPVGSLIFSLLDGQHSQEQIAEAVAQEFEVTPDAAQRDLEEFLRDLQAAGMLEIGEAG